MAEALRRVEQPLGAVGASAAFVRLQAEDEYLQAAQAAASGAARAHDLWQLENVKDFCPGGPAWMPSESLTSPDWIAGWSKSDPLVGCRGRHFNYGRLRPRGAAAVVRGRETTTSQLSRKPLAHTRCSIPTVPTCPASTCDGTRCGAQARSRRPKSSTRPLGACHLLPSVQLTPKALFHLAL